MGGHGVGYYISHTGSSQGRRSRGSIYRDHQPTESRLRETAERYDASTPSLSWSGRARHALQCLSTALFLPVSILIYSVNISSALGYLMLVNIPNSQEHSSSDIYWKAQVPQNMLDVGKAKLPTRSLTVWVVTIAFLLVHGLFFGKYTMEWFVKIPHICILQLTLQLAIPVVQFLRALFSVGQLHSLFMPLLLT